MSDRSLRELERQLSDDPGNEELVGQWMIEKVRAGEAMVKTFFKIKYGDKYFSENSWNCPWTKVGSKFATRAKVVEMMDRIFASKKSNFGGQKGAKLRQTNMTEVTIIQVTVYTVEQDSNINFIEEKTKLELESIKTKRAALEKEERRLMQRVEKTRKELMKKEKALTAEVEKVQK